MSKQSGKKLQGNGLFESSRMMLPEHKEAYLWHQQQLHKEKTPPDLDPQQLEFISQTMTQSMRNRTAITIVLFGEFGRRTITGKITRIDPIHQIFQIAHSQSLETCKLANIVHVSDVND